MHKRRVLATGHVNDMGIAQTLLCTIYCTVPQLPLVVPLNLYLLDFRNLRKFLADLMGAHHAGTFVVSTFKLPSQGRSVFAIYAYIYTCIYIYIYIYRERERDVYKCTCMCVYIYMYIYYLVR